MDTYILPRPIVALYTQSLSKWTRNLLDGVKSATHAKPSYAENSLLYKMDIFQYPSLEEIRVKLGASNKYTKRQIKNLMTAYARLPKYGKSNS
ncbi:MAG: hypothetical protein Q7S61_00325 [bacterium]|nr:hypothetical protein [bacterium]